MSQHLKSTSDAIDNHLTLDKEAITLNLKPGQKAAGGRFDRFGLFSVYPGGSQVKVYLDDLTYTIGRVER